jgi:hypothetical protein
MAVGPRGDFGRAPRGSTYLIKNLLVDAINVTTYHISNLYFAVEPLAVCGSPETCGCDDAFSGLCLMGIENNKGVAE